MNPPLPDQARTASAITPRMGAVLPVPLHGQAGDMDRILAMARRHGLRVVEGGAQAHGARWRRRRIGPHGGAAAWRFHPARNLDAMGGAAAVTADDPALAQRLRVLRNPGTCKALHPEVLCLPNGPTQAGAQTDAVRAAVHGTLARLAAPEPARSDCLA